MYARSRAARRLSSAGEGDLRVVVEIPGASLAAGVGAGVAVGAVVEDVVWLRVLEASAPAECWVGRRGWGGSAGIASV